MSIMLEKLCLASFVTIHISKPIYVITEKEFSTNFCVQVKKGYDSTYLLGHEIEGLSGKVDLPLLHLLLDAMCVQALK